MNLSNTKPSKIFPAVALGYIVPQSVTDAAVTTGSTYITVPAEAKWMHIRLACGAGAGSVAITAAQATAAAGTGTKAFTLSPAISGILTASKVTVYDYSLDGLDVAGGFAFLQLTATVTGTLIISVDITFGPSPYFD